MLASSIWKQMKRIGPVSLSSVLLVFLGQYREVGAHGGQGEVPRAEHS
jgi:hypothetical protein